jgi:hypothetical protein
VEYFSSRVHSAGIKASRKTLSEGGVIYTMTACSGVTVVLSQISVNKPPLCHFESF